MGKFLLVAVIAAGSFVAGTMNADKVHSAQKTANAYENTALSSFHENCSKVPYSVKR